jgi:hypothetical protein
MRGIVSGLNEHLVALGKSGISEGRLSTESCVVEPCFQEQGDGVSLP